LLILRATIGAGSLTACGASGPEQEASQEIKETVEEAGDGL